MGTLRDGLLGAGLVSQKRKEHEERKAKTRKRKARKGKGGDPEAEARRRALEEQARLEAEEQAQRVAQERARREEHERKVRVKNLLNRQRPLDLREGWRRFCFTTRDKRITWLRVTESVADLLERGEAGIVEPPFGGAGEGWLLVQASTLEAVHAVDGQWIRFWNGHPDHEGLPRGDEAGDD